MTDVLVVNFAALRQASAHIATAVDVMRDQLSELEREAAPLVATWDGEAKASYEQRQAAWRRAAGELSSMLHAIKLSVDQSAADYLHTERRNAALFQ
jgi:WXG100 family type VII secretion target